MRRAGLALAMLVAAGGCQRHSEAVPEVRVVFTTDPQPPHAGAANMAIQLSDAAAHPLTGARIELEGNMTHAGMAPVFALASEVARGRYQAQMNFTMPGDWVVLLHVKLASGGQVEKQVEIRGVRPQ